MKITHNKLKQLIKESLENSNSFETTIDTYNVHITGLDEVFGVSKNSIDNVETKFSVIWNLDIESRTWGIKSINTEVLSVRGSIDWMAEKEYLDEDELEKIKKFSKYESETFLEGTIELTSLNKFNNHVWEIDDSDFEIHGNDQIYPTELEIDFIKMKIRVY